MRIITTQTTVYKFEELNEEARDKAVRKLWDLNVESGWWDYTYEDAERIGLKITSFDLDRNNHATGHLTQSSDLVAEKILKEHVAETCRTWKLANNYLFDVRKTRKENFDPDCSNELTHEGDCILAELEAQFEKDLLAEYASILQKEYEYLTSEETIFDLIKANEYEFTEEGDLV